MFTAFFKGILLATKNWKLVLLLLVASILFSIPVVIPIFLLIVTTTASTSASGQMMADNLYAPWAADMVNQQFPGFSLESFGLQLGVGILIMGIGYLLLNIFLQEEFWKYSPLRISGFRCGSSGPAVALTSGD
ncbi:MAG: hypothetical protein IPL01_04275 [Acidobacteria bacterium]|nr:hypothetical protein [Acidobacteriota bacterium]